MISNLRFVYVKLMVCTVNGRLTFTVKLKKKKMEIYEIKHWGEGIGLSILKPETLFLLEAKEDWLQ